MASDYLPDVPPGEHLGDRMTCQNLESLTFADESVDVVRRSGMETTLNRPHNRWLGIDGEFMEVFVSHRG